MADALLHFWPLLLCVSAEIPLLQGADGTPSPRADWSAEGSSTAEDPPSFCQASGPRLFPHQPRARFHPRLAIQQPPDFCSGGATAGRVLRKPTWLTPVSNHGRHAVLITQTGRRGAAWLYIPATFYNRKRAFRQEGNRAATGGTGTCPADTGSAGREPLATLSAASVQTGAALRKARASCSRGRPGD